MNWDSKYFVRVFVRLDRGQDIYVREVYSFGSLLGDLGGFKSALFIIFGTACSFLTNNLWIATVAKNIYQVRDVPLAADASGKLSPKSPASKRRESVIQKQFRNNTLNFKEIDKLDSKEAKGIVSMIFERKRFMYSHLEYFRSLLCCRTAGLVSRLRQRPHFKRDFHFLKAKSRIVRDLDVVQLLKKLQSIQIMLQVLLSPANRLAMIFSKENLI
jgi:hypothetical protein